MMAKDPNKLYGLPSWPLKLTFQDVVERSQKEPYIGVTQGGSSRKSKGAKVAATVAAVRQPTQE